MNLKKFYTSKAVGFAIVVLLIATFYGGMAYEKSKATKLGIERFGSNMQNRVGQFGGNNRMSGSGGFTIGEIISKDDKSITVKINSNGPDGTQTGSKIIFLGTSTTITKTTTGSTMDLNVGTSVSITGTPNTDGSLTAQAIQIRPNTPQGAKVQ